jgi:hypothetical protein
LLFPETKESGNQNQFAKFDWSEDEMDFFNLESRVIRQRSFSKVLYHPEFIEAYNKIAVQNESFNFVDSVVFHAGLPLWRDSYVHSDSAEGTHTIFIPLAFESQTSINALITVHTKEEVNRGRHTYINAITKESILDTGSGNHKQKLSLGEFMLRYEAWLYRSEGREPDQTLISALSEHTNETNKEVDEKVQGCEWQLVGLCSDDETQTSWIAGIQMIPLHLDHDQDGILNSEDQDWYEFLDRTGIENENEFYDIIAGWWDQNYYDDQGSYDDFYYDFDWEDQWGWYQEMWERYVFLYLEGGGADIYWDDYWDDYWGDYYDGYYGTPFTDNENADIQVRSIRCQYYYFLICDGTTPDWWDILNEGTPCTTCGSDLLDPDAKRAQLLDQYIGHYRLDDFKDELENIISGINPFQLPEIIFNEISTRFLHRYLNDLAYLLNEQQVVLSDAEVSWLADHPDQIATMFRWINGSVQTIIPLDQHTYIMSIVSGGHGITPQDFHNEYANPTNLSNELHELSSITNEVQTLYGPENPQVWYNLYGYNGISQWVNGKWVHTRWNYWFNENESLAYDFVNEEWLPYDPIDEGTEDQMHFMDALIAVFLETGHLTLEGIGMFPVLGEVADGVNALWYLAEGDIANASLATLSCVPFVGIAPTAGKWARNSVKLIKNSNAEHWLSDAGMVYLRNDNGVDRLGHVFEHAKNSKIKDYHGVFDDTQDVVGLVDEAWAIKNAQNIQGVPSGPNVLFDIHIGRRVGWEGGKKGAGINVDATNIIIILKQGTNEVITAFPKI